MVSLDIAIIYWMSSIGISQLSHGWVKLIQTGAGCPNYGEGGYLLRKEATGFVPGRVARGAQPGGAQSRRAAGGGLLFYVFLVRDAVFFIVASTVFVVTFGFAGKPADYKKNHSSADKKQVSYGKGKEK